MRPLAVWLGLAVAGGPLAAQVEPLKGRLDDATYRAVAAIVDSAAAQGLPSGALVSKAQEGAMKRAPGPAIVAAVRALWGRLGDARSALGPAAEPTEIEAGAAALRAGADTKTLGRLRERRREGTLTVPLIVLADLTGQGVPVDSAVAALETLMLANATDAAYAALRRGVEQDIRAGTPATAAATSRARSVLAPRP